MVFVWGRCSSSSVFFRVGGELRRRRRTFSWQCLCEWLKLVGERFAACFF